VTVRALPYGPTAVMFEVESTERAAALAAEIRAMALPGVVEVVPAARTVLVDCTDAAVVRAVAGIGPTFDLDRAMPEHGAQVELPTIYDGSDLAEVATYTGLSVAAVIDVHCAVEYRAAFCGFAPGFTYLTGLPAVLHMPRRAEPRPRVPAGSVAIAAEFTSVYPTASPGGWHLLGRTDEAMWEASRARPSLVVPGDRVRFVPVR